MAAGKAFNPIVIEQTFTITGGLLRQPQVIKVEEKAADQEQLHFVAVSSSEAWLCAVLSGKCPKRRPLGRCQVFHTLRAKLASAPGALADPGDKMAALGMDDDEFPPATTPQKRQRRVKGPAPDASVTAEEPTLVHMKSTPSAIAEERPVWACRTGRNLMIDLDSLPWLVTYLKEEIDTSGVPAVVPESPPKDEPSIWWDFRDECWCGRLYGEGIRKTLGVRRRMAEGRDLAHLGFADAKAAVHQEMVALLSGTRGLSSSGGAALAPVTAG